MTKKFSRRSIGTLALSGLSASAAVAVALIVTGGTSSAQTGTRPAQLPEPSSVPSVTWSSEPSVTTTSIAQPSSVTSVSSTSEAPTTTSAKTTAKVPSKIPAGGQPPADYRPR